MGLKMTESDSVALAADLALPGTCLTAHAETLRCRIHALEQSGCAIKVDAEAFRLGTAVELWIGALGPFRATVCATSALGERLVFEEQLPSAIVAHFLR